MKQANIKENTIFSILYQIVVFITPLITSPYLSRVLGASGIGVFTYTQTIVNYFFLVGMLGINNYGSRAIARVKDDPKELSHTFWQIYYMQILQGALVIVSFLLALPYMSSTENKVVFIVQGLQLLSIVTDVNWFAFGLERFKFTTIRNLIIKAGTIVAIFLFIRSSDDVWIYSFIVGTGTIIGLLAVWPLIIRETRFELPQFRAVFSHLKPNFILFLPQIGASLQSIDKVMLGSVSSAAVGYYGYAENIINVPFGIITAVNNVFMPRISNLITNGERKQADNLLKMGFHYVGILSIALCFGIISVSKLFIPLYLGEEYTTTAQLLCFLALLIPIQGITNVLRMMHLMPNGRDGIYVTSVTVGAVLNLIGNAIMIPLWGGVGACVSTIVSSVIVLFVQIIMTGRDVQYGKCFLKLCPYVAYGFVMMLIIGVIDNLTLNPWISLLLEVGVGGAVFCILSLIHIVLIEKDSFVVTQVKRILPGRK